MTLPPAIFKLSVWDRAAFGVESYEIMALSRQALELAVNEPGHYTIRMDPLASKKLVQDYGFYYCDTLIEPYCPFDRFSGFEHSGVEITADMDLNLLLEICHGAFSHGRFHRDFNLSRINADQRYDNWLRQLHVAGKVYGLMYHGTLIGFIAAEGNTLVLHAVAESFRGHGLAKFLWTPVCKSLYAKGYTELVSSVSAANVAVMNLYASLGFRFRRPVDVYHRLIK